MPGQAAFISANKGVGGEDAQAFKGFKIAGWDLKGKTCNFLSFPPTRAYPSASALPYPSPNLDLIFLRDKEKLHES